MSAGDEIDLSPLRDALNQLVQTLELRESGEGGAVFVRPLVAAAIKSFEFTYEMAVKAMKRWLDLNASEHEPRLLVYREQIRLAARRGLIEDPEAWFKYREDRNKTSLTYRSDVADEVLESLPEFVKSVQRLIARLDGHQ